MRDYAFYNIGFAELRGWRRGIVPFRRLLRRLLRPMLYRQAELLSQLGSESEQLRAENRKLTAEVERLQGRLGQVEESFRATHGLSCDLLAAKRRLAAMEDHLIAIDRRKALATRVHAPHFTNADSPQTQ